MARCWSPFSRHHAEILFPCSDPEKRIAVGLAVRLGRHHKIPGTCQIITTMNRRGGSHSKAGGSTRDVKPGPPERVNPGPGTGQRILPGNHRTRGKNLSIK
ncbi:hypothetical protein TgHK011_002950 [Trichoderma gracile]|nr:hypothetical protein TgHK011_002950 [Trichoderma gracile]